MRLWTPEKGTPQGAVISPLLANLYLHPVDVEMREAGLRMIRYADDMVILCGSREEAEHALTKLRSALEAKQLTLHPVKTKLVDATLRLGFQFLGYDFFGGRRYPREPSERKLREQIRKRTRRNRSDNLKTIIEDLNKVLRGWFAYFKHPHAGRSKVSTATFATGSEPF
ncbi:MAG TPA: reverse transcriptase domain-containing protein [Thermoanaerobaculia bacterium]|nr:reverse transcriptase domain-containing protein [Thermoanaerobaculia bacterium]